MEISPLPEGEDLYEGVHLLRKLMDKVIFSDKLPKAA
jgi:hypothetical protein